MEDFRCCVKLPTGRRHAHADPYIQFCFLAIDRCFQSSGESLSSEMSLRAFLAKSMPPPPPPKQFAHSSVLPLNCSLCSEKEFAALEQFWMFTKKLNVHAQHTQK